ncbi:cytochrome B [Methylophaga sp. 41_12_T18]|nr:cytochrome B [Methylophaga sp. 41_12_T18]
MSNHETTYPTYAKIIHLGIVVFGITAFLTGELAEDVSSYFIHAYLGLSLAAFILLRVIVGFTPSTTLSFKGWSPLSRLQWQLAFDDVKSLLTLAVPHRDKHQGLAGLTQAFGLIIFAWMAVTGTGLFLLAGPTETVLFEFIEEVHEIGESLIPLYLGLHVGAVLLHSFTGQPIWQKMFKYRTDYHVTNK